MVSMFAAILVLAYPFLVFFGLSHFNPRIFGVLLVGVVVLRAFLIKGEKHLGQKSLLVFVVAYSFLITLTDSELLLRFYPVAINLSIALMFAISLNDKLSIIEKIALKMKVYVGPNGKGYMRKLTGIWAALLACNAVVAGYTALFSSLKIWAIYNGFLSYLLFSAIIVVEYFYRKYYIKTYGP